MVFFTVEEIMFALLKTYLILTGVLQNLILLSLPLHLTWALYRQAQFQADYKSPCMLLSDPAGENWLTMLETTIIDFDIVCIWLRMQLHITNGMLDSRILYKYTKRIS